MLIKSNSSKSLKIARYFIHLANQQNSPITNKKLQKLVYYAQAWSLVLCNKEFFPDPIEARVHGPAILSLYSQYKSYGFNPIKEVITSGSISGISQDKKKLLDNIWSVYGKFDAGYLEMLTHSEKPWQEARAGLEAHESSKNVISTDSMKQYYSQKLKAVKSKQ